ncbi:MAG: serine hydrolase domain-containing protein [Pseudomonadota bacterium]
MKKALIGVAILALAGLTGWRAIGPDWRALIANAPTDTDLLFWSVAERDAAFRMLDRVPFVSRTRKIATGDSIRDLPDGAPLDLATVGFELDAFMDAARIAGFVVVQDGEVRLERYGLGFGPEGRWTSFSVAKSLTSTLVGAAVRDGYIKSLNDPVSNYVAGLQGSAYDDVSIEQLLTMTSGVAWNEDYEDPESDVSQFLNQKPEGEEAAIVSYMKKLPRAHPPGDVWNYSTGETNLIGVLVAEAVGKPLATYAAEKIWTPFGMEAPATWTLAADGREVSGCCVQARTRDFARIGLFALEGGAGVVPDGWFDQAATTQVDYGEPGEGYGYQWWTLDDGAFRAFGIFGQAIFIDPSRSLVVAMNANWTTALGYKDGERERRAAVFAAVRSAIDAEASTAAE